MTCTHHYILEPRARADQRTHGTCKLCGAEKSWADSWRMPIEDWRATNAVSAEAVARNKRMLKASVIS